ncbi:MAG: replication restart helicase PriA [Bacteroidota bacterium]
MSQLFAPRQRKVADLILPVPTRMRFSYLVPERYEHMLVRGMRVIVPFGKRKLQTGVVAEIWESADGTELGKLKLIDELLDERPVVPERLLKLWAWVAEYYFCSEGEAMQASLPSGFKLQSELTVTLPGPPDLLREDLSDEEYIVLEAVDSAGGLLAKDLTKILGVDDARPLLKRMHARRLVELNEEVYEKVGRKTERVLHLNPALLDQEALSDALAQLSNARKQEQALLRLVTAAHSSEQLSVARLMNEGIGRSSIKALIDKAFAYEQEVDVERLRASGAAGDAHEDFQFTPAQAQALTQIREHFSEQAPQPVLLHGVTGSGKTHLYIDLIKAKLAEGKQALYLLPEIGLTKQSIDRLRRAFGDAVGVYHSRFNDGERIEIWRKVLDGTYRVIVGVRSAILLPFKDLGLIVVDEAHDQSLKQHEPAPYYNARDLVLWYAQRFQLPILLGTATPSIETYKNALDGKYHLVELKERAVATQPVQLELVDMRVQIRQKLSQGALSSTLLDGIRERLKRKEQVILFQNRRGFSHYLKCENCGHIAQCINCDISLTFHKYQNLLRCHYCGFTDDLTNRCRNCGSNQLTKSGYGTERLEQQLEEVFPEATVARMDQDTMRRKHAHERLLNRLESGEIDILVGTQMVTKGLDVSNVTLVAVIDADRLMNFPDFRATESAYQLLTQFAGRAGRASKPGTVLLQTYDPEHELFPLIQQPYISFYSMEAERRKIPFYPPFSRLIRIETKHREQPKLATESQLLVKALKAEFGNAVLGPEAPPVARVRNQYRMQTLIKLRKSQHYKRVREQIAAAIEAYYLAADTKSMRIIVDIDPR